MRKVITVALPKGGVGKTTTAVNLSASLAIAEKKTLLIDFDPAGACAISLGFSPSKINADICDVFNFSKSIEQAVHKTDLENLDFIPTNVLNYSSEERLGRAADNEYLFRNIVNQAGFRDYDYIIIDCPPYLRGLTTIAMIASNSVLIPLRAGQFSLSALRKIFNYIIEIRKSYNNKLNIEGILLNMYEPKTNAWAKTEIELNEFYSSYLLKTTIPKSIALTESEFYGKPAILVKANSIGAAAYLTLANEIIFKNSNI